MWLRDGAIMPYGIPYMGSKSRIAPYILKNLPKGKRFVDLFGGGFAMSHAALMSKKYDEVYYNEIDSLVCELIKEAIKGKYNYKRFTPEFITREQFEAQRNKSGYVNVCWSFGNKCNTYIYGRDIEHLKHLAHDLVVYGKKSNELEEYARGISRVVTGTTIPTRRKKLTKFCKKLEQEHLERLQHLERVERLAQIEHLERVEIHCGSYKYYEYQDGDIVYCDPPYENTQKYTTPFDIQEFYDWVATRDYQVWFSSYRVKDERFKLVYAKKLNSILCATNNNKINFECLYTNKEIA